VDKVLNYNNEQLEVAWRLKTIKKL
jgi:hypothetical protein